MTIFCIWLLILTACNGLTQSNLTGGSFSLNRPFIFQERYFGPIVDTVFGTTFVTLTKKGKLAGSLDDGKSFMDLTLRFPVADRHGQEVGHNDNYECKPAYTTSAMCMQSNKDVDTWHHAWVDEDASGDGPGIQGPWIQYPGCYQSFKSQQASNPLISKCACCVGKELRVHQNLNITMVKTHPGNEKFFVVPTQKQGTFYSLDGGYSFLPLLENPFDSLSKDESVKPRFVEGEVLDVQFLESLPNCFYFRKREPVTANSPYASTSLSLACHNEPVQPLSSYVRDFKPLSKDVVLMITQQVAHREADQLDDSVFSPQMQLQVWDNLVTMTVLAGANSLSVQSDFIVVHTIEDGETKYKVGWRTRPNQVPSFNEIVYGMDVSDLYDRDSHKMEIHKPTLLRYTSDDKLSEDNMYMAQHLSEGLHKTGHPEGILYRGSRLSDSDTEKTYLRLALRHVKLDVNGNSEIHISEYHSSVLLANTHEGGRCPETLISRDGGVSWNPLPPPIMDGYTPCDGCTLHLESLNDPTKLVTHVQNPNVIVGFGYVGHCEDDTSIRGTFMSADGGYTWTHLHGETGIVYLKHPGVLVFVSQSADLFFVVKPYAGLKETIMMDNSNTQSRSIMNLFVKVKGTEVVSWAHLDMFGSSLSMLVQSSARFNDGLCSDSELVTKQVSPNGECLAGQKWSFKGEPENSRCTMKPDQGLMLAYEKCACGPQDYECKPHFMKNYDSDTTCEKAEPEFENVTMGLMKRRTSMCKEGESFVPPQRVPYYRSSGTQDWHLASVVWVLLETLSICFLIALIAGLLFVFRAMFKPTPYEFMDDNVELAQSIY